MTGAGKPARLFILILESVYRLSCSKSVENWLGKSYIWTLRYFSECRFVLCQVTYAHSEHQDMHCLLDGEKKFISFCAGLRKSLWSYKLSLGQCREKIQYGHGKYSCSRRRNEISIRLLGFVLSEAGREGGVSVSWGMVTKADRYVIS